MDAKKFFKRKESTKIEMLFFIVSVLFGLSFLFAHMGADDVSTQQYFEKSFMQGVKWIMDVIVTWSSRLLINMVFMIVRRYYNPLIYLYAAGSMYVIQKSLYLLIGKREDFHLALFISAVSLSFPFVILSTSGWIMGTTSYYGPACCMLAAMVPIRKTYDGEKLKLWEELLYVLIVIYAANGEQNVVVLLGIYTVAFVYFLLKKNLRARIVILWILTGFSFAYMLLCPGNYARSEANEAYWFPAYGMLDPIDKFEIGLSTTLRYIFCESELLILICLFVMMLFIWRKYSDFLFRVISVVPFAAAVLLGPLRTVLTVISPAATVLYAQIDYHGAYNAASMARGSGPLQFVIFLILIACICAEIFLINDTPEGIVCDLSLAVMGVGSRVMLGFSPTIYASSTRTYTAMLMCFSAIAVHDYANYRKQFGTIGKRTRMLYVCGALLVYGFLVLISGFAGMFV